MQRHGISNAAVDESGQRGSSGAGGASGLRDPVLAVKLDGKRNSRNAAAARVARARTAHSSRAAGTAWPQNLPQNLHSAGPRALRALSRLARPWPSPAAPAVARDNVGSVHAAAVAPGASRDNAVPPANAATGRPLPGTVGCNSAAADGTAGTAAHIPSRGRCANSNGEVDPTCRTRDTQMGPREVLLPQVKPRRRGANSTPGRSYWQCGFRITRAGASSQDLAGHWPRSGTVNEWRLAAGRAQEVAAIDSKAAGQLLAAILDYLVAAANST
jgi:hypothetical protein